MAQQERREQGQLSQARINHRGVEYHVGDRVIFLKNNRPLNVRNGQLGTVVGMHTEQDVLAAKIDNGPKVLIPLKAYPHIGLGYSLTTYKAQGATFQSVYCLISETPNRELAVVQASRHREECKFFVDELTAGPKLKDLAKSMERSQKKLLAMDSTQPDRPYVVLRPEFQR